ncbi:hypothetical protein [Acinetobacter oleivorans]|uniref:hypothetical protein n=1 Tax=Acinetobacter oleivorans TaxID=1148157 RepID=UPI003A88117A
MKILTFIVTLVCVSFSIFAEELPDYEIKPLIARNYPPNTIYHAYKLDRKQNVLYYCTVSHDQNILNLKESCYQLKQVQNISNSSLGVVQYPPSTNFELAPIWLIDVKTGMVSFCLARFKCISLPDSVK